jgi:hypothetical protein
MAAKPKCPKGCTLGEFRGSTTIVYGDGEKPPSHAVGKAKAIVAMSKAGMSNDDIQTTLGQLGLWNLKKVDGKLLVAGSKFLVAHVEAEKAKAA